MRITPEEIALIKSAFKGNIRLLQVLRKVFLPEIDPYAPLGQQVDLWLSLTEIKQLAPDVAYQYIMIRNGIIGHVENQLIQLNVLAEMEDAKPDELKAKRETNSAK